MMCDNICIQRLFNVVCNELDDSVNVGECAAGNRGKIGLMVGTVGDYLLDKATGTDFKIFGLIYKMVMIKLFEKL